MQNVKAKIQTLPPPFCCSFLSCRCPTELQSSSLLAYRLVLSRPACVRVVADQRSTFKENFKNECSIQQIVSNCQFLRIKEAYTVSALGMIKIYLLCLLQEMFYQQRYGILRLFTVSQVVAYEFINRKIFISDWQPKQCLFP